MQSDGNNAPRELDSAPPARPAVKQNVKWQSWLEVKVRIYGLPNGITTLDLHRHFQAEGKVYRIEIWDKRIGSPAEATVVFSPVPRRAFWELNNYQISAGRTQTKFAVRVELQESKRRSVHPSPVDPTRLVPQRMEFPAESLDFGVMCAENSLMVMKTVQATKATPVRLILNMNRRQLEVKFALPSYTDPTSAAEQYQFQVPLTKLGHVHDLRLEKGKRAMVIPLGIPPSFYRRKHGIAATHDAQNPSWSEWKLWSRQTSIGGDAFQLQASPAKLGRSCADIDVGTWTTYRITFGTFDDGFCGRYHKMLQALRDYNVVTLSEQDRPLAEQARKDSVLWALLDLPDEHHSVPLNTGTGLNEMQRNYVYLPFPVRFQLEVCLSQGSLSEYDISEEFVHRLASLESQIAVDLLEKVADTKRRFYNPLDIFHLSCASVARRIPNYCFESRGATVTPSTVYFTSPAVEITNRVIRHFWEHRDRFLRVKFSDELKNGKIFSSDDDTQDEVFERVRRTMRNGIIVGGRKFEFVAFGNSQFREHGAMFFASAQDLTAAHIRNWMGWGNLTDIKNVAKKCARLGQCLSTTRAINTGKLEIVGIADEQSYCGTYCFTDGVGKISPLVGSMICSELGITVAHNDLPSVFQFRQGGAKGVLAVDPSVPGTTVCLRQSQYKFHSAHRGLEVIRVSQFAAATTNRQLIILLSWLGVPDEVFVGKMQNQLSELNRAMIEEQAAIQLLQKNIDFNQLTLALANVINDGFMKAKDPFVMSMLQLWRSWSTKFLKEKAKIFIDQGACLLGCVDEAGVLQGHFDVLQPHPNADREQKEKALPEIFVRVDFGRTGKYKVIEGVCILCRNPSLHPGDIRVVRAVDKPELYHLNNVVVLPRTGDRDLPNMCSGGDLDGDDYLVIWDQQLIPALKCWNHPPMDFTPRAPAKPPTRDPTVNDMIDFFVTYMKNDRLPTIAHAHLAFADYSQWGIGDRNCLELTRLRSDAVDYPKSGVSASMKPELHPRLWPHFMEKRHKPAEMIYTSRKILGRLYDMVQVESYSPQLETPFDPRVLDAYDLDERMVQQAGEIKMLYDAAIRRVMAQHDVRSELEVWSTFCLSHNFEKKDYTFAEELGRIISAVKERFRTICIEKAGGKSFEVLGPFVAAMYTVTAREVLATQEAAIEDEGKNDLDPTVPQKDENVVPFISFPWLFERELGKIVNGTFYKRDNNDSMYGAQDSVQKGVVPTPYAHTDRSARLSLKKNAGADVMPANRKHMHEPSPTNVGRIDDEHRKMIESGIEGPGGMKMFTTLQSAPTGSESSVQIRKPLPPGTAGFGKNVPHAARNRGKNQSYVDHRGHESDVDSDHGLDAGISAIRIDAKLSGIDRLSKLAAYGLDDPTTA